MDIQVRLTELVSVVAWGRASHVHTRKAHLGHAGALDRAQSGKGGGRAICIRTKVTLDMQARCTEMG